MLWVTLCGVMASAAGWGDMEDVGASTLAVLRASLPVEHGAPRADTRRRFCRAVDAPGFREVFVAVVRALVPQVGEPLIAIDGTPARRSPDGAGRALHLVSALATAARLVLAQTATAEQSNAMTAIPA